MGSTDLMHLEGYRQLVAKLEHENARLQNLVAKYDEQMQLDRAEIDRLRKQILELRPMTESEPPKERTLTEIMDIPGRFCLDTPGLCTVLEHEMRPALLALIRAERRKERERCALICDDTDGGRQSANRIRALPDDPEATE